jgi:hypothetical protein
MGHHDGRNTPTSLTSNSASAWPRTLTLSAGFLGHDAVSPASREAGSGERTRTRSLRRRPRGTRRLGTGRALPPAKHESLPPPPPSPAHLHMSQTRPWAGASRAAERGGGTRATTASRMASTPSNVLALDQMTSSSAMPSIVSICARDAAGSEVFKSSLVRHGTMVRPAAWATPVSSRHVQAATFPGFVPGAVQPATTAGQRTLLGQAEVGHGLRLHALRRVDEQHGALHGRQGPPHLPGEVHVARRVHQVQQVALPLHRRDLSARLPR